MFPGRQPPLLITVCCLLSKTCHQLVLPLDIPVGLQVICVLFISLPFSGAQLANLSVNHSHSSTNTDMQGITERFAFHSSPTCVRVHQHPPPVVWPYFSIILLMLLITLLSSQVIHIIYLWAYNRFSASLWTSHINAYKVMPADKVLISNWTYAAIL